MITLTDVGAVLVSNLVFYAQSTIVVISRRRCITAGAKQKWCDVVLKVITGNLNLSHLFSQCIFFQYCCYSVGVGNSSCWFAG